MRIAAYATLIKNNKVLLLRRHNTGYKDGLYSMIAGHVEGGETIADATIREAQEEAGIKIARGDLGIAHTMHRMCPDVEYIDFFLTPVKWHGEPQVMENDKCDDLSWHPTNSLPENTIPYVRQAIEHIENGVTFSEFDERAQ